MERVNLAEKFATFEEPWVPKIIGELNGQYVKIVRTVGEYVWHQHDDEDELFYVIEGRMDVHLRARVVELRAGEFFIVPRGVEHKPVSENGAQVLMFEPMSTRNTGNVEHEYTIEANELERI